MEEINNRILVVCLSYNNNDEVLKYINHLEEHSKKNCNVDIDIVIVENGKQKISKNIKLEKKKNIYHFDKNKNLGYLNGLYYGFSEYKKKNKIPKFIIFSNTDIEIEENFFQKLIKKYKNYQGIIAPNIYVPDKKNYQNPYMKNKLSKNKLVFLKKIVSNKYLYILYNKLSYLKKIFKKNTKENSQYIFAPHGSFIIFTKEYFENIELKYGSFLYGEEVYIGHKSSINNNKIFYDENLNIFHNEHSVTGKINYDKKLRYFKETYEYLLEEIYG